MNTDLRFYVKHTPEVIAGSLHDVTVMLNICDYATINGVFVIPDMQDFAYMCHMSIRQVRRVIAKYRNLEYIRVVQKGGGRGHPTIYKLDVIRFMKESQDNRRKFEEKLMESRFSIDDFGVDEVDDEAEINYDHQSQNGQKTVTTSHSLDPETVTDSHSLGAPKKSMPYSKNINTSSSRDNNHTLGQSQFSAAAAAPAATGFDKKESEPELPFDAVSGIETAPAPPPLESCNWSFLGSKDRRYLPDIKAAYQEYQGSLDAAGWVAFAKNPGGWNGLRMRSAVRIKENRSHEQAFAAIVIAGLTGARTLEAVAEHFNGTPAAGKPKSYSTHQDVLDWRNKAATLGQPAASYLEFRNGVSVNAHGEYYNNGTSIDEQEALAIINRGLSPTARQRAHADKQSQRSGGPKPRQDLGRGITRDEDSGQFYASGRPVDETYARQLLSM